ncbi:hypothetical protein B0H14DRAFT_3424853 [Mycena olivaceomarginata]|nr:hypothetical protein B0H14DRAFT_3424853 [Mycena olivaceomarginata]
MLAAHLARALEKCDTGIFLLNLPTPSPSLSDDSILIAGNPTPPREDAEVEGPAHARYSVRHGRGRGGRRAEEITWELAEMNFRYELCRLDEKAVGFDRHDDCAACFPGPLIGPDVSEGQKGFAALALVDRLPHLLRLARLMMDWSYRPRPDGLARAALANEQMQDGQLEEGEEADEWTAARISALEQDVARYYTQTFFHFFGRPAIVPLHLEEQQNMMSRLRASNATRR